MAHNDDSEVEILSETDAGPYEIAEHVGTTTGPLGTEVKHKVLVLAEQRCREPSCPRKKMNST
jgi:hypothetical protein